MPRSSHSATSYCQLQADGVAALVAEIRRVGLVGAALLAEHVAGMQGSVMTVCRSSSSRLRGGAGPSVATLCTPSLDQWRKSTNSSLIRFAEVGMGKTD